MDSARFLRRSVVLAASLFINLLLLPSLFTSGAKAGGQIEDKKQGSRYSITGAVHTPGSYNMARQASLSELIALADGLAENHGDYAIIWRKIKDSEKHLYPYSNDTLAGYRRFRVSLRGALTPPYKPIYLEPGDIVIILTKEVIYVSGEVKAPGKFSFKEGMTLRGAISLAGGMTFKAVRNKGVIRREDPDSGKQREIYINVGAIVDGKKEDVLLAPNDSIIIPGHDGYKNEPFFWDPPPLILPPFKDRDRIHASF